jgi:hypothetical protein
MLKRAQENASRKFVMPKNEEFYAEFKSAEHVPEKFTWKFCNQTMTVRKKTRIY